MTESPKRHGGDGDGLAIADRDREHREAREAERCAPIHLSSKSVSRILKCTWSPIVFILCNKDSSRDDKTLRKTTMWTASQCVSERFWPALSDLQRGLDGLYVFFQLVHRCLDLRDCAFSRYAIQLTSRIVTFCEKAGAVFLQRHNCLSHRCVDSCRFLCSTQSPKSRGLDAPMHLCRNSHQRRTERKAWTSS